MNTRWAIVIPLTAFSIILGLLIGLKLNSESIALLIGVAIGVLASLPSQLILLRRANHSHSHTPALSSSPTPPPPVPPAILHPASLPAPRRFVVIGADEPSA